MDKSWMETNRISKSYVDGVAAFTDYAVHNLQKTGNIDPRVNKKHIYIPCPCTKCLNHIEHKVEEVQYHLYRHGIDISYTKWTKHGEEDEPSISAPKPVNATTEFVDDMDFAYIPTDGPATVEMVNATKDNFDVDDLVKFQELLLDAEKPLYEGCPDFTKLSAIVKLLNLKGKYGASDKFFTELLGLIKKMLPAGNEMVEKTYQAKKVMRLMGSGYKKIHVCINNCLLYWKNDKDLTACRTCGTSRWKVDNKTKKVYENIPAKAWHTIDEKFPEIAEDTRNLRLGISTDGVDVNTGNMHHHVWPVLTIIYNLPPWLWVDMYDASTKDNFNLCAVLLWTINDYPALGTLCGCPYNGFKGCVVCGKDTNCVRLSASSKQSYVGYRRYLPYKHPFRKQKKAFNGQQEFLQALIPMSIEQIYNEIQKQKRNTTEEEGSSSKVNGQNEKNVAESIVGTLLHVPGKTKDGLNALLDLAELGVKPELFVMQDEDKTTLPPAGYTLTNAEKDIFCEMLHNIKVLEGYCSNLSSLVNLKDMKLTGLKSHDYHMLMQEFLPIAIRLIMHPPTRYAIIRCTKVSKGHVRNRNKPEGCIAEETIVEEIIEFFSKYHKSMETIGIPPDKHETYENEEGKPLSAGKSSKVSTKLFQKAHFEEVERELAIDKESVSGTVRWISYGPHAIVVKYDAYNINGYTFCTKCHDGKVYQNSRIWVLDYRFRQIPLFKCDWVNHKSGGVKRDKLGYTLVDLNNLGHKVDPFVLASQALQVFYVKDLVDKKLSIVFKTPPKNYKDTYDEVDEEFSTVIHHRNDNVLPLVDRQNIVVNLDSSSDNNNLDSYSTSQISTFEEIDYDLQNQQPKVLLQAQASEASSKAKVGGSKAKLQASTKTLIVKSPIRIKNCVLRLANDKTRDAIKEDIKCKDSYDSNLNESTFLVTPLFDSNEDEFFSPSDDIKFLLHHDPSTPKISKILYVAPIDDLIFDPGGDIDEIDTFFDVDISTDIEDDYHDSAGDILYLESLLSNDTILSLPPMVFLDHDPRSLSDIDDLITEDKVFDLGIHEKTFSLTYIRLPFEDRHYLSLTYVIRTFLPYFTYPVDSSFLLSSGSEDTIFDPGISVFSCYSLKPVVSHRSGTFMCFNVYLNILNESPMEILSSTCFVPNITMIWGESS
ncbi:putative transposase-associated domain-containing protein [Tanacetum coccineum]